MGAELLGGTVLLSLPIVARQELGKYPIGCVRVLYKARPQSSVAEAPANAAQASVRACSAAMG